MKDTENFHEGLHRKRFEDFDDVYYGVMSSLAAIQEEPKNIGSAVASPPRHEYRPTKWINVSNLYSMSNEHLSNVEKLSYLKSSLSTEPLSLI
ncbi:hypothetical protein PR048_006846 [Dryococelus australis]|uniref:Uncharacterized protein n=1 Tax=Dryococelus australis TaxID=614101 RepID=A0ABQ9IDC4_9NEOP|nr:hypothetical protein PR048_006846 [Dryococelus australis]